MGIGLSRPSSAALAPNLSPFPTMSMSNNRQGVKPTRRMVTTSAASIIRPGRVAPPRSTAYSAKTKLGPSASAVLLPSRSTNSKLGVRLQSSASASEGLVRTLRRTTSGAVLPSHDSFGGSTAHFGAMPTELVSRGPQPDAGSSLLRLPRPSSANFPVASSRHMKQVLQKTAKMVSSPGTEGAGDGLWSSKGLTIGGKAQVSSYSSGTLHNAESQVESSLGGARLANQAAALGSKLTKALSGLGDHSDVEASQSRVKLVGGVFERALEMDAPFAGLLRRIKGEYEDALAAAWGARADTLLGMGGVGGLAAGEAQTRCAQVEAELNAVQEDNDAYAHGMRQLEAENDELRHELMMAINHARESEAQLRSYEHALYGKGSTHHRGGGDEDLSAGARAESAEPVDEEAELAREMPPSARPGAAPSDLGSGRLGRVRPIAPVSSLVPALDMLGIQRVLAADEAEEAREAAAVERAAMDSTYASSSAMTVMGSGRGFGKRTHNDEDEDEGIGLSSEGGVGGQVARVPSRPACVPALALAGVDFVDEDVDASDILTSGGVGGDAATVPKRPECVPSLSLAGLAARDSYQDEFVANEEQVNGAEAAAVAASGTKYSHADAAIAALEAL